ncbi:hypothetical protein LguiA_002129 [Lonicera macranthoides]
MTSQHTGYGLKKKGGLIRQHQGSDQDNIQSHLRSSLFKPLYTTAADGPVADAIDYSDDGDVWHENGSSWNGSIEEFDKASDMDREWQRRRNQFHTVEELQARVTALEARLEIGSSCVNPLCSFALPGGSSRFPLSAENNMPAVIPTAMNLPEPALESFLRLLMSVEELAPEIPLPTVNPMENGAFLTEVNLLSFLNPSYDQATLDAVYHAASDGFLSQSSLDDFVADFAETTGPDWTALGDIRHDFSDYSSSDLSTILNFDADDLQILQPFF